MTYPGGPSFEHRIDTPMLNAIVLYKIEMWLKANFVYYRISTNTSGDVWLDTFQFTSTWNDEIEI